MRAERRCGYEGDSDIPSGLNELTRGRRNLSEADIAGITCMVPLVVIGLPVLIVTTCSIRRSSSGKPKPDFTSQPEVDSNLEETLHQAEEILRTHRK